MRQTESSMPAACNASCQASTCWYTLSTSVPSRSKRKLTSGRLMGPGFANAKPHITLTTRRRDPHSSRSLMKKIDVSAAQVLIGSGYPAPYDEPCRQRQRLRLGDAAGLSQFGVNILRLPPGVWSSQRHWHSAEDEFVYVLEGEVVLVSDGGEEVLRAGECAGFKAGVA